MTARAAALLLAVGLDLAAREPVNRWHPVAWIGHVLAQTERWARGRGGIDGTAGLMAVVALVSGAAAGVAAVARRLGWAGIVLEAVALKPAFAVRELAAAAAEVKVALDAGDVDEARRRVGYRLVSRETRR